MSQSTIDLNECDVACTGCVRKYKKKHKNDPSFAVACKGIPIEYVPKKVLALLPESEVESAVAMLDPVSWASKVLDWHCLDPDGEVWKRKSNEKKLPQGVPNYYDDIPYSLERLSKNKSPFHRPYQAEMLRCSAKKKIFRIGRQAGKTETLVVAMLHSMFTNKGFRILLLTPFQAQIDMIFTRIEQFFADNPVLYNSKKRMVKAPNYQLELHNGSYIRGFTAGTQSKGNAAQVRGQSANMLVFDEADFLSRGDMDAALAVTINFPNATIWMSSTPSGKREKFYENCHSKIYKEFHFPSQVNPNWTEELEESLFQEQGMTELGYKHEILADFGDIQEGVFKSSHVDAAMADYTYESRRREPGWRYCVGVDWNDVKIGTTIAVVGFNPADGRFILVDRLVVKKETWTQMAACEEIIKINRKWLPDFVYIDKGYGSTQHEILRKFGYDSLVKHGPRHMDSRIHKIVKAYDFGSQLEIRDLFTKQPIKKHAKPFLVENAIRRFESGQIAFPSQDKQLEAELRGYIIDRVTPTGIPVFKQSNEKVGDHNLDALMLALVAFELELTAFGKPAYMPKVAFSGKFGESVGADLGIGSVTVSNPYAHAEKVEQDRNEHRPDLNRTSSMQQENNPLKPQTTPQLPASNTATGVTAPKLWDWPGWGRDAPHPQRKKNWVKSLRKAQKPPSRKKF